MAFDNQSTIVIYTRICHVMLLCYESHSNSWPKHNPEIDRCRNLFGSVLMISICFLLLCFLFLFSYLIRIFLFLLVDAFINLSFYYFLFVPSFLYIFFNSMKAIQFLEFKIVNKIYYIKNYLHFFILY